ncbi:unnamed protein product [Linum tenue]|uniref:Helicase ATP-binding domain-containing protein n=1 Tax=Linum tenue TaxID=586396 RepID=A0AAV0GX21_9ROSI|nr:unnamed protein product [Linum tenue]
MAPVLLQKGGEKSSTKGASGVQRDDFIDLDDDDVGHNAPKVTNVIVIIDSDDEDNQDPRVVLPFQELALPKPEGQIVTENEYNDLQIENRRRGVPQMVPVELGGKKEPDSKKEPDTKEEPDIKKDKGTYLVSLMMIMILKPLMMVWEIFGMRCPWPWNVLSNLFWSELFLFLVFGEDVEHHLSDDYLEDDDELCDHSFILKDDIGYVCRICGVIERGIESIIEVQFYKFKRWEVENIPLLDFYTMKADSRHQQLDILKQWLEEKSILFLGYKQFSSIICDSGSSVATSCQKILLKRPLILILDEGHTPRNENTDVLQSLAKIKTPRKVVLSGTLYQNHVKKVFNILNLARPKFLRLDSSKGIVKWILSKGNISGLRKQIKVGADATFFELVEHTIQKDPDFNRKVSIIRDLREMTSKVLHYYKGDFLDELHGLVDFTMVLNLSNRQKHEVNELKKLARKFKRSFVISGG